MSNNQDMEKLQKDLGFAALLLTIVGITFIGMYVYQLLKIIISDMNI